MPGPEFPADLTFDLRSPIAGSVQQAARQLQLPLVVRAGDGQFAVTVRDPMEAYRFGMATAMAVAQESP